MRLAGRFELHGELGRGAAGTVYAAIDAQTGRDVAVKVVRVGKSGELRARFLREVETARRVQHPNVVRLVDVGEEGDTIFLVMELVRGPTLRARLDERRALAPDEALALVEKLARAAHAAHEAGVVHRDLKPENVLFAHPGADSELPEPRIADFGIAKDLLDAARLTRTGAVVGTPEYVSPEQAAGQRDVDARADVWALGVILHELVSGAPPFRGATPLALFARIASEAPPPLVGLDGARCPRVEAITKRALEKERDDRFPSALALAEACAAARRAKDAPRSLVKGAAFSATLLLVLGAAALLVPKSAAKELPPPPVAKPPAAPPRTPPPPPPPPAPVQRTEISPRAREAEEIRQQAEKLLGLRELDAALEQATRATEIDPGSKWAWFTLCNVKTRRRDTTGAIEAATRSIEVDPDFATGYECRGLMLASRDGMAAAIPDLARCVALNPQSARYQRNHAHLLAVSGRLEDAVVHATLAIALDPGDVFAWANRGSAREKLGDKAGALADLEMALEARESGTEEGRPHRGGPPRRDRAPARATMRVLGEGVPRAGGVACET